MLQFAELSFVTLTSLAYSNEIGRLVFLGIQFSFSDVYFNGFRLPPIASIAATIMVTLAFVLYVASTTVILGFWYKYPFIL